MPVKNEDEYNKLRDDMSSAWEALVKAGNTVNDAATPASTKYYLHYQKWRVAMNWAQMIIHASQDDFDKVKAMNAWAKNEGRVGDVLDVAANNAKKEVQGSLRDLIDAQSR